MVYVSTALGNNVVINIVPLSFFHFHSCKVNNPGLFLLHS